MLSTMSAITVCSVSICDRPASAAKGLCHGHYKRLKYGLPLETPLRRRIIGAKCTIDGCGRKHRANGLCGAHIERDRRGVTPLSAPVREDFSGDDSDLAGRLRHYAPEGAPDQCWEWTRSTNKGYGVISIGGGKMRGVHIVAWEIANDRVLPRGHVVRHSCDNPPCTNPAHLLLGTHADNQADKAERGRHGVMPSGFRHRTHDEVRAIRAAAAAGVTISQMARDHGCTRAAMSRIVSGQSFADVH
jgi:hypothetical protein